jgi:predicted  nucleic acid-binding Zn-ribbon protein
MRSPPGGAGILAAALLACHLAVVLGGKSKGNPVRKVVRLLQKMDDKVRVEGEKKEKLFDKFMCHCQTSAGNVRASIGTAQERVPQLESSITEVSAQHAQLKQDLKASKQDREDAKASIATAEGIREKDAEAFEAESSNLKSNIDALSKAIAAIQKGTSGFLQTRAATTLRRLMESLDMTVADHDLLSAFLSGSEEYDPQSGEILGILKQLQDHLRADLQEVQQQEAVAVTNHQSLMAASAKQVAATTKAIEEKTGRAGDLAVELTTLQDDLEDTREGLAEDQAFLVDLQKSCTKKQATWELYKKSMGEELVAISETIKLLNDDDANDLFRQTIPSPGMSFLQTVGHTTHTHKHKAWRGRRRAAAAPLRRAGRRSGDPRMKLLEMALRGKKGGIEKIIPLIDQLIGLLKEEQTDDDNKKAFCLARWTRRRMRTSRWPAPSPIRRP